MASTRGVTRRWVPSMFHRRLLLLAATAVVIVFALATQLTRLTVTQAATWRVKAESALVRRRLIPTARGRILDRRMRVLAADQPSYNVCVRYPVLTGDWAYDRARRGAYRANRARWDELGDEQIEQLVAQYQQPYDAQVRRLWQTLCEVGPTTAAQLNRRKRRVIRKVEMIASDVWLRRLASRRRQIDEPVVLADVAQPIGEQQAPHPLLSDVDRQAIIRIRQQMAMADLEEGDSVWDQVSIEPDKKRAYPLETMSLEIDRSTLPGPLRDETPIEVRVDGVGLHIIGALRDAWKEDVERRPYRRGDGDGRSKIDLGGYLPGDHVGRWGIESSQEDRLRGLRGQVVRRLDSIHEQRVEPTAGNDVVLTLDIQLQARIQAVMGPDIGLMRVHPWQANKPPSDPLQPQIGDRLNGAAVVLDVAQGQVLAAVSVPTFSLEQLIDVPQSIWDDPINRPYVNRAVAMPYQPGSTVKPMVVAMAMTGGHLAFGESIVCDGHLDPQSPNRYRCWIYKHYNSKHGPLDGIESIARSCNIFFYTLGRRMGAHELAGWYHRFGLGQTTGCGLREEVAGDLPDITRADEPNTPGFTTADAIFMAIGQGPIRWTPLQAASCYAALARGGYVIPPTFHLLGSEVSDRSGTDLGLDPAGVQLAIRGLRDVVSQRHGSAHHIPGLDNEVIFTIDGVELYGKSGTAQGVSLWSDQDGDNRFNPTVDQLTRRGDHAWMVCLAQRPGSPRPDYVIAVVVEYGGSGGAVAGPIVNQILHAMRGEGYL